MICPFSRSGGHKGVSCNKSCARYDEIAEQCIDVTLANVLADSLADVGEKLRALLGKPSFYPMLNVYRKEGGDEDDGGE